MEVTPWFILSELRTICERQLLTVMKDSFSFLVELYQLLSKALF